MSVGDGKIHISLIITLVFCLQSIPIFAQQQEQQQSGCHCPQSTFGVTVFRGEIKSPGYPNLYCASLQCVYEILPANERSIVLLIESFETEATYDFLDIFETFRISDVTHEVKLKRLSGNDVGTPSFVSPISGGFRLKFSSDATEHFRGFLARFNRVRSPDGGQKCPTVFYEATMQPQELPSPLKNFHFETGCVFMINSTERYAISFRVDKIDSAAELTLYEAEEYANDKALKRIVNPGGPSTSVPFIPQQISSRTNSLVVVFRLIASHYQRIHTTPRSTTSQNEDYFKASFSRIDSPCNCFENNLDVAVGEQKTLSSPGFPMEYCDNLDCSVRIKLITLNYQDTNLKQTLLISITNFSLEFPHDMLHIFSRKGQSSHYLMSISGDGNAPGFAHSYAFDITEGEMRFVTDHSIIAQGFNLTVGSLQQHKDCTCADTPSILPSMTGSSELHIPVNCQNIDCFWIITKPSEDTQQKRLLIDITYDFIDADEESVSVMTANMDGHSLPHGLRGNLKFRADNKGPPRGSEVITSTTETKIWFHLAGGLGTDSSMRTIIKIDYRWKQVCQCGQRDLSAEEDTWKTLSSPDYPGFYCHLMNCTYVITAPDGYTVALNVTDFSLELNQDLLTISDVRGPNTHQLLRLTGDLVLEHRILSSNNVMMLEFTTDNSIAHRGFLLYYTAVPIDIPLHASRFLIPVLILLTISFLLVAASIVLMTYKRNLLCFERGIRYTTSVGFSNISQTTDASSPSGSERLASFAR